MPKDQARSRCPSDAWNRRQNAKSLSALVPSLLGNKLLGASGSAGFQNMIQSLDDLLMFRDPPRFVWLLNDLVFFSSFFH